MPPGGVRSTRLVHDLGPHLTSRPAEASPDSAELAVQLAHSDPQRALGLSRAIAKDRRQGAELRATALWAAALASIQLGALHEARTFLDEGRALVEAAGLHELRGEMAATAANLWFHAQRLDRAFLEIQEGLAAAEAASAPRALAALHGQVASFYFRLGRYEAGWAESERALGELAELPAAGAATLRARILSNRGLALCYRSIHEEARRDLAEALELNRQQGAAVLAAQLLHNLGFAATQRGDLAEALTRFEEAHLAYLELGLPVHRLLADRAELLIKARLVPEARQAATEAAEAFEQAGLAFEATEALLTFAEACLADEDLDAAVMASEQAGAAFSRQGRPHLAALAVEVSRRAFRLSLPPEALESRLVSAASSATALEAAGWPSAGLRARVEAARLALRLGRLEEVASLTAQQERTEPAPAEEALCLHRAALRLAAGGDRDGALSKLAAGMEAAFHQASELKALSGQLGHGAELAELAETALGLLLEAGGEPGVVLEWVEWARALANAAPGRAPLLRPVGQLLSELGEATLLELVAHRGRLLALAAGGAGLLLEEIGPLAAIEKASASIHLALGELVRPPGRRSRAGMAELFLRSRAELESRLSKPLRALLDAVETGGEELFLVPAGSLHDLAWGLLPVFEQRAVVLGHGCEPARPTGAFGEEILLVAGPGLEKAADEVARLAALYGDEPVRLLQAGSATRENVLAALGRAKVIHLAVHGRFRADNPFLSSFELSDGPLSLLEMSSTRPVPRPLVVVLSACDAGRVVSHASEELAGPVPGLLGFEGGHVIAPVAPVADRAMSELSGLLHGNLAGGRPPGLALAKSRRRSAGGLELTEPELVSGSSQVVTALSAGALVCHGPSPRSGSRGQMLGESPS